MRDQAITTSSGRIVVSCAAGRELATLETPTDARCLTFTHGELLMTIEALAMAYATLRGARPDSAARGVHRTLRNRTTPRADRAGDDTSP